MILCNRIPFVILAVMSLSALGVAQFEPRTTIGGYGELHYNEPDGSKRGQLDFHRFVVYLGHEFSEELSFKSEIELEHTLIEAGEPEGGELSIEQAFLDYRLSDRFGLRGGILLPPVGLINLYHEPPTFHGVERPNVDRVIIPTTWRESGVGVYGRAGDEVAFQLALVAGFDAAGFDAASGLRGGRQKALQSNPANPSVTGRVDYSPIAGLQLGGSFFVGNSAADHDSIGNASVALWSGDARFTMDAFSARAVGAFASIIDANLINAKFGNDVADQIYGLYVETAYNILHLLSEESEQTIELFARYERYNTQASTSGFSPLRHYDRHDIVVGLTYKPTYNTAFKADYMFMRNALNNGTFPNTGQLNLGIGYYFF